MLVKPVGYYFLCHISLQFCILINIIKMYLTIIFLKRRTLNNMYKYRQNNKNINRRIFIKKKKH